MAELKEWINVGESLKAFYESNEGLQRKPGEFSIPEVMNWVYHWREEGHDIEWIKQAIRDDAAGEWRNKHPGNVPNPPFPQPDNPVPTPVPHEFQIIKVTDESDGRIPARMYSYWSNAVVLGDMVYVFCGHEDGHPHFFKIDARGTVSRLGALVGYTGESEGWYWDRGGRLYIIDGPRLHHVNPFNGEDSVVFDISDRYPNHNLWQAHSSADGTAHCATVRQNSNDFNPHVATVFVRNGEKRYVSATGVQDEAHITSNGAYGIIEEDDNNLIIDTGSGQEVQRILDADGALSHIDCGPNYMVGEDNIHGRAWRIDLPNLQRTELEQTWGMGHVSVAGDRCLLSNQASLLWMDLNGGGLTHILEHGMVSDGSYDTQVKANLDPTGVVGCYMSNHASPRQDVFIVRLS